jgi:hypothetical protein
MLLVLSLPAAAHFACGGVAASGNRSADGGLEATVDAGSNKACSNASDGACTYSLCVPGEWKACAATSDCVVGTHTASCTGDSDLIGVNQASLPTFNATVQALEAKCPSCVAPPGPDTADVVSGRRCRSCAGWGCSHGSSQLLNRPRRPRWPDVE